MNIKPKPEGSTWTDEQWQAINARGNNILVSAAAGSGKTAVLVERLIRKVTDPDHPVDIDRLLIVTFTDAAAAEMRKRIGEAIEQQVQRQSSAGRLRRQLSLLNKAHISTLHSFCLSVVRKYYYVVDLDPYFRIVDKTEAELVCEDILDQLLEEEYAQKDNHHFYDLVNRFSGDRSDDALRRLVRQMYHFSRSHPAPSEWLDGLAAAYDVPNKASIEGLPWTETLLEDIRLQLRQALQIIEKAVALTKTPGGPAAYADNLLEDAAQINMLLEADGWMNLYDRFQSVRFGRLRSIRKADGIDEELQAKVKAYREAAKKQVQHIHSELFSRHPDLWLNDLQNLAPAVKTLVRLVKAFASRFQAVKREKAVLDFSDLEHLTIDILTEKIDEDGQRRPSRAALEYQRHFDEVLVDEYQDTNLVQETILQLLSRGTNLFMVGDVKQSIYRFRLADPGIFLDKYQRFPALKEMTSGAEHEAEAPGWRIDLSQNFRSRRQILDGVNFIFRQLMDETVGEMAYDDNAELRLGNTEYPHAEHLPIELVLINKGSPLSGGGSEAEAADQNRGNNQPAGQNRGNNQPAGQNGGNDDPADKDRETAGSDESGFGDDEAQELENAQLEARWIAREVKRLIRSGHLVYDKQTQQMRPISYRDMVVLMRSMPWAPTMMEEFKQLDIPVYAELTGGYFEAVEVTVILSLLQVIDNPYQDIPLAAVLRSPIVGFNEEELAAIRMMDKTGAYYEALKKTMQAAPEKDLQQKAARFYERLQRWRTRARQGSLASFIWELYRETGYYDYVGGMPGGKQRQANLRTLFDRARAYESTSFRGLFRFLRFIERMRERGDDLGTARALGEQEDVLRMMTIHKSKGLEFPVVFVAGLYKKFNLQDVHNNVVLDKELGIGCQYIDPEKRVAYPTLPQLAIKKRIRLANIAEEMRVLYVALTRAKEKCYLLGTVSDASKSVAKWLEQIDADAWLLPAGQRAKASSYLDWIAPAVLRHASGAPFWNESRPQIPDYVRSDPSEWRIDVVDIETLMHRSTVEPKEQITEDILRRWRPVSHSSALRKEIERRLGWTYPYISATRWPSKQAISDLQREMSDEYSAKPLIGQFRSAYAERPRFLEGDTLSPAERGTAMHAVMQHIRLDHPPNKRSIDELLRHMVNNEQLTPQQAQTVDSEQILAFFHSPLGQRLLAAAEVHRETPFSIGLPAVQIYSTAEDHLDETVLIQGVVDCVFREADGKLILVDYKTDAINDRFPEGFQQVEAVMRKRYGLQMSLYIYAWQTIWREDIAEAYLYFFDGGYVLNMKQGADPFDQTGADEQQRLKEG